LDLKRILIPIDFSKTSKTALPWAVLVAAETNAELILLHVMETFPIDYILGHGLMNETITPLMKEREAELKRMAENLSKSTGLKASALVRAGKPFKEICSAARNLGADLITLTTRGHTGLKRVWVGSTAERVVRHATCPVLSVRERVRKK
ncbi:MAG: universal stress protein, partial [Pedosphaera parvula]|nr:universal stress protein [Pedosphaera parvula]